MTWNKPYSETELLRKLQEQLQRRLPSSWRIREADSSSGARADDAVHSFLEIQSPDGTSTRVAVLVKTRSPDPKDIPRILENLGRPAKYQALVVAPFLGQLTRQRLEDAGTSYADATGNLRLTLEHPAVFLQTSGASKNPWREPRPLHSLKGPAAGRVVRALCDFQPPYGVRELAQRSASSLASTARVVDLLDREALVVRDTRGKILQVDWFKLIPRWTQDYSLFGSNSARQYLEPRGLPALLEKLRRMSETYCVTASLAAAIRAPVAPARLAAIYVVDREKMAQEMDLRPVESGANVVLLQPFDPVVFDRSWTHEGVRYTALSQATADLLTSPGRGPAEAQALMAWMQDNENAWRS